MRGDFLRASHFCTRVVRKVHQDNQELRNNHEALSKLDHLLDHGDLIEDVKVKKEESKADDKKGENEGK